MVVRYHLTNEGAARRAKEAMSLSDYRPGSATAEYRHYVDQVVEIAERQKKRVEPEYHEKIDSLLGTYARKLAKNMNKGYEITARVPSVLIAGPSNFPVRVKEKQNTASDRSMEESQYIQGLLDKIRSTGMGGISADDPQAVSKLEKKLEKLETLQELMKTVNAYYRKHRALDGCPHLTERGIENLKTDMASGWHYEKKPFQSQQLSNNNAEIRRLRGRIEELTRQKEVAYVGWKFDGGTVEINRVANRLQIFFEGKPDAAVRGELKSNGFRWSPRVGAWQRQLNDTIIHVADRIKYTQLLSGKKSSALQPAARREKEKPSTRTQLNAARAEQTKQPPAREKSKGLEVEQMQKFENVDVLAALEQIMRQNTAFYQSDFGIDKDIIRWDAISDQAADKTLLWMSRPSGTYCPRERDVSLKDTRQYNTWKFCGEQTRDKILAYAVGLTGTQSGAIRGNLYELDYPQHSRHVIETAQPASVNRLFYEHGTRDIPESQRFDGSSNWVLGNFLYYEAQPRDPAVLQEALRTEQHSRGRAVPGDFKVHATALHDNRIETKARCIVDSLKDLSTPNSPNKTHFMVGISPHFAAVAPTKDNDRLFAMLPYESLCSAGTKGRYDVYAVINRDERRDASIRRSRPSIHKQLFDSKQAASPKKAAARTRKNELEV